MHKRWNVASMTGMARMARTRTALPRRQHPPVAASA